MGRHQAGYVYKAGKSWHVRYYLPDSNGVRAQESHRLCSAEMTKGQAKKLAAEHMVTVNELSEGDGSKIVDFYARTYLPYIKANKAVSTVAGYEQIWNQHLKRHFGTYTLQDYRA